MGPVFQQSYAAELATGQSLRNLDTKLIILLTFAELEAFTSLGLTGFLTLNHTRVAHQQALSLQCRTVLGVVLAQGAGDSHSQSLSLAGDSTAIEVGLDIPFTLSINNLESLIDDELQRTSGEIFLIISIVDGDFTATRLHINAGNSGLSSTYGVDYLLHCYYLISLMLMTLGF